MFGIKPNVDLVTDVAATQPPCCKIPLYHHQLVSLERMRMIENTSGLTDETGTQEFYLRFGFLANPTGSGKSAIILSICGDAEPVSTETMVINTTDLGQIRLKRRRINDDDDRARINVNTSLIIVPQKIVQQWKTYLANFTYESYVVENNKTGPKDEDEFLKICENARVILVGSNFIKQISPFMGCVKFARFIIDEPDSIKIVGVNMLYKISAHFYWLASATVSNFLDQVYYRHNGASLVSIFNQRIGQQLLYQEIIKYWLPLYSVNCGEIDNASVVHETIVVEDRRYLHAARGFLSPQTMELLNGDRVEEAISSLNIQKSDLVSIWKAIELRLLADVEEQKMALQVYLSGVYENGPNPAVIAAYDARISSATSKVNTYRERVAEMDNCLICFEDEMTHPMMIDCCLSKYCSACILKWLSTHGTCPKCRRVGISAKNLTVIGDGTDSSSSADAAADSIVVTVPRTKMEALESILHKVGRKFLIYVLDSSGSSLRTFLAGKNIEVLTLLGRTSVGCAKLIEKFREPSDKIQCMIMSSINEMAGFNLEFVDSIVIYQTMSDQRMNQMLGRALRLGRPIDMTLRVFHLHYHNEINRR